MRQTSQLSQLCLLHHNIPPKACLEDESGSSSSNGKAVQMISRTPKPQRQCMYWLPFGGVSSNRSRDLL